MSVSCLEEKRGRGRTAEEMSVLQHAAEVDESDKHCASRSLVPF